MPCGDKASDSVDIEWIVSAKRPETRDRRLAEAIDLLEAGRRRNDQYR